MLPKDLRPIVLKTNWEKYNSDSKPNEKSVIFTNKKVYTHHWHLPGLSSSKMKMRSTGNYTLIQDYTGKSEQLDPR